MRLQDRFRDTPNDRDQYAGHMNLISRRRIEVVLASSMFEEVFDGYRVLVVWWLGTTMIDI